MRFLGLNTCTPITTLILGDGARLRAWQTFEAKQNQSSRIFHHLQTLLKDTSLSLQDLEAYAVTRGPGSFTGLRIGLATIQGLSFAKRSPIAGLHTLELMAFAAGHPHSACIIPSRKGRVFAAIYAGPHFQAVAPPAEYDEATFSDLAQAQGATIVGPECITPEAFHARAWETLRLGHTTDAFGLSPTYLVEDVAKPKGSA